MQYMQDLQVSNFQLVHRVGANELSVDQISFMRTRGEQNRLAKITFDKIRSTTSITFKLNCIQSSEVGVSTTTSTT